MFLKRVAAYCRFDVQDEDPYVFSYDLQTDYYRDYIRSHENWILAGIYVDEVNNTTQMKYREQFQKMMEACENGEIDLILTKSLFRFARNGMDCLSVIHKLKNLDNPVDIYFETERMYAMDENTEKVLGIISSASSETGI
jgi:DNA invertase Pin-like site-specific DNA recombinase